MNKVQYLCRGKVDTLQRELTGDMVCNPEDLAADRAL